MKGLAFIVSLLLGTIAHSAWSQGETSSFLQQAAEANLAEVDLAEVAQERAARPEVKEYARHLKQAHEQASEAIKSIAERKNVALPDEPAKMRQQQKEQLSALDGKAFDQAYLKTMIREHEKSIRTFEQQAKNAQQDPDVQQYARQTLPALRQQLGQARLLQQQSLATDRPLQEQSPPSSAPSRQRN